MLPGIDGFEVCRRLREQGSTAPVLFLTAREETEDRIRGFATGGDDYLTKPFSVDELVLRVAAILRRTGPEEPAGLLRVGSLTLDPAGREARRAGSARGPLGHRAPAARVPHGQPGCGRVEGADPRPQSGATTTTARRTSSSCTSGTCAASSTTDTPGSSTPDAASVTSCARSPGEPAPAPLGPPAADAGHDHRRLRRVRGLHRRQRASHPAGRDRPGAGPRGARRGDPAGHPSRP